MKQNLSVLLVVILAFPTHPALAAVRRLDKDQELKIFFLSESSDRAKERRLVSRLAQWIENMEELDLQTERAGHSISEKTLHRYLAAANLRKMLVAAEASFEALIAWDARKG